MANLTQEESIMMSVRKLFFVVSIVLLGLSQTTTMQADETREFQREKCIENCG